MIVDVTNQKEFNNEVKKGNRVRVTAGCYVAVGNASVIVSGSASIAAWGNCSIEGRENCSIEAWGNCSIEGWGNCSIEGRENCSIVGWENCSIKGWGNCLIVGWENCSIEAWGNCSIEGRENCSIVGWENCSIKGWGNCSIKGRGNTFIRSFSKYLEIKASAHVVVMRHVKGASIHGGIKVDAMKIKTTKDWCEFYGVKIVKGIVTLFKALDKDFNSSWNMNYSPGSTPEAPDWDGGKEECGGGLHFSASPSQAKWFNNSAKKYAACPVNIKDIAVYSDGDDLGKVKAKKVSEPCYEVDIHGKPI